MGRVDKLIEKAETQAAGMRDLGNALTAGAPFNTQQVAQKAATVKAINETQENAKATLKSATKQLEVDAKSLNDMVARNVSFFQATLGKKDPRLPKGFGQGADPPWRPAAEAAIDGEISFPAESAGQALAWPAAAGLRRAGNSGYLVSVDCSRPPRRPSYRMICRSA